MNNIRKLRIEKGWNQKDLVAEAKISRPTINAVEKEKLDPPLSIVREICVALGVKTIDEVFPLIDEKKHNNI